MAKVTIAVLEERVSDMKTDVDSLMKVIFHGNGDSLVSRVSKLIDFMNDYKWLTRTLIASVISNVIGLLFSAWVWFVKIAPYLDRLKILTSSR